MSSRPFTGARIEKSAQQEVADLVSPLSESVLNNPECEGNTMLAAHVVISTYGFWVAASLGRFAKVLM